MLKENYIKQIEIVLMPLGIYVGDGSINLHKKFVEVSSNPKSEIKAFYKKIYISCDEKLLDEAIDELLPRLYMNKNL